MSTGKTLLALLTGVAAGAAIGILIAPDKGSETRKKLFGAAGDLAGNAMDTFNKGISKFSGSAAGLQIAGNWNEIKGKLKQQFTFLNDLDLTYIEGKETELLGKLQTKLGKTKEEVTDIINHIAETFQGPVNVNKYQ